MNRNEEKRRARAEERSLRADAIKRRNEGRELHRLVRTAQNHRGAKIVRMLSERRLRQRQPWRISRLLAGG